MSGKDLRREDLIATYVSPHPEKEVRESFGALAAQSLSMSVIMLRSKHIAWVSFLIALSSWFRDRPSVSIKTGKSPWLGIMVSVSSIIIAYMAHSLPSYQRNFLARPAATAGTTDSFGTATA